jgi:pyruvate formate lyase activating enzyme
MDVTEIVQEVEKDRIFYRNSGGGVTLSGGEPLVQYEVAAELLQLFKERGLHTALDTCGYASEEIFEEILQHVDLLLFDIKQLDAKKHQEFTGVDNDRVLRNVRFASGKVRTWLRIPLIEGFNDSPEHMKGMAQMAKEMGVEKISLLPYHEGGKSKSEQIGKIYRMPWAKSPREEHIQRLKEIASEMGVITTVGN